MKKLQNFDELIALSENYKRSIEEQQKVKVIITIGMGTCGIAAGAGEILEAFDLELNQLGLQAHIRSVGCIGMCAKEPLVDIQLKGQPRITYANVKTSQVPRIIQEHIIQETPIKDWLVGMVPLEW